MDETPLQTAIHLFSIYFRDLTGMSLESNDRVHTYAGYKEIQKAVRRKEPDPFPRTPLWNLEDPSDIAVWQARQAEVIAAIGTLNSDEMRAFLQFGEQWEITAVIRLIRLRLFPQFGRHRSAPGTTQHPGRISLEAP